MEQNKLRSSNWFGRTGKDGFAYRAWMKKEGIPSDMFEGKPVIGICNTWSELTPCNSHFRDLAESIKKGVLEAGGFPVEFPVMSLGETLIRPTAMLYRNLNNYIQIHPLALLHHKELNDILLTKEIESRIFGYENEEDFFIKKLSYGIAKIGAAFYPNPVIVRFSDFKTNEYYDLVGGKYFEPHEENPMIGWRGASRYYSNEYKAAFGLECKGIKIVREEMGLGNVVVMIPFCRTVEELIKVKEVMKEFGLERGKNNLELYLMAEIPSNIILADEFAKHIDGFSIGSNDLTQLTLGLDRDSSLVAHLYDERNPAVKQMIAKLIDSAKRNGVKVGICGQGPSDFPDFAQFLIEEGIDSISLTPDSVIKTIKAIASFEK